MRTEKSDFLLDLQAYRDFSSGNDNAEKVSALRKKLYRAIEEELTKRQRQILALYFFENMTMPKIAKKLGVNKSTVSRTLRRARRNLVKVLKYSI